MAPRSQGRTGSVAGRLVIALATASGGYFVTASYLGARDPLVEAVSGDRVAVLALLVFFGTRTFLLLIAPGLTLFALVVHVVNRANAQRDVTPDSPGDTSTRTTEDSPRAATQDSVE